MTLPDTLIIDLTAEFAMWRQTWATTLESGTTAEGETLHTLQTNATALAAEELGLAADQVRVRLHSKSPDPRDPFPITGDPTNDALTALANQALEMDRHAPSYSITLDEHGNLAGHFTSGNNRTLIEGTNQLMAAAETLRKEKLPAEEEATDPAHDTRWMQKSDNLPLPVLRRTTMLGRVLDDPKKELEADTTAP